MKTSGGGRKKVMRWKAFSYSQYIPTALVWLGVVSESDLTPLCFVLGVVVFPKALLGNVDKTKPRGVSAGRPSHKKHTRVSSSGSDANTTCFKQTMVDNSRAVQQKRRSERQATWLDGTVVPPLHSGARAIQSNAKRVIQKKWKQCEQRQMMSHQL